MLNVVLYHKQKAYARAYVDSGSTAIYVPRLIADRAGLLDEGPGAKVNAIGISGSAKASEYTINLISLMCDGKIFDTFNNSRIIVPSEDDAGPDFVLMGRDPLFAKYDVTFSDRRKELILERS